MSSERARPSICGIAALALLVTTTAGAQEGSTGRDTEIACDAPGAREFDFWIGEWDVANRHRNPEKPEDDTWYETGLGTDRVHAILDGCAIVEHWDGALSFAHVRGFSVRAWDPEKRAWVLVLNWPSPRGPFFSVLEGGFEDGIGRFYNEVTGPDGNPVRVRYTFSDIGPDRLRWTGARSTDGGRAWRGFWRMEFRRRDPVADRALFHAPTRRIAERCARDRARVFDFLAGDWRGSEVPLAEPGEPRQIEIRAFPILEGCAIMEFVRLGKGEADRKRFRVRSFLPEEERWVLYSLDRERPVFRRWESPDAEDLALVSERPDGTLERIAWTPLSDDAYRRERSISEDGGSTWRPVARAEMERM